MSSNLTPSASLPGVAFAAAMLKGLLQGFTYDDLRPLRFAETPQGGQFVHYGPWRWSRPGESIVAVLGTFSKPIVYPMRWGLVPANWRMPLTELPDTSTVHVTDVARNRLFKGAYKNRRCIVPVSQFLLDEVAPPRLLKRDVFCSSTGPVLWFAGLWEVWADVASAANWQQSVTILVGSSNDVAVPMLLDRQIDAATWLSGEAGVEVLSRACAPRVLGRPMVRMGNHPLLRFDGPYEDDACLEHVLKVRVSHYWGDRCPKCQSEAAFNRIAGRRAFRCTHCRRQINPCRGTLFEQSRTRLSKWYRAVEALKRNPTMSTAELQRLLGTTYKCARSVKAEILDMLLVDGDMPIAMSPSAPDDEEI